MQVSPEPRITYEGFAVEELMSELTHAIVGFLFWRAAGSEASIL